MGKILERSRYLVIIAVVFLLLAAIAAFIWGSIQAVTTIIDLISSNGKDPAAAVNFIALMDKFLIATALYVFGVSLYELFIKDLAMPEWLVVHNLHDLKTKLSSVVVLVMATTFLEHLLDWKNSSDMLQFGIAIALISAALIAFNRWSEPKE
jgi:uncharacterized membrane protein YqhA